MLGRDATNRQRPTSRRAVPLLTPARPARKGAASQCPGHVPAARHRPGRRGPLRQRRRRLYRFTGTPAGAATGATSASSSSPPRDTTSRCGGLTPACPGLVLMIGASGVVATHHDRDAPRRGARSCLGRGRAQTPRACPGKAGGPGRQWLAALGDGSRSAKCGVEHSNGPARGGWWWFRCSSFGMCASSTRAYAPYTDVAFGRWRAD